MTRFHFKALQASLSLLGLPIPLFVYTLIWRSRQRARKGELPDNAAVLLPIYDYYLYADITRVLCTILLYGFIWDVEFGEYQCGHRRLFSIAEGLVYTFLGEALAVFTLVLLVNFIISPSAGKYAIFTAFKQAGKYSIVYGTLTFFTYTHITDYTSAWIVKLVATMVVNIYLITCLVYAYDMSSTRWTRSIYTLIYCSLLMWTFYTMNCIACLAEAPNVFMLSLQYIAVFYFRFIHPVLIYFVLIDDSKYWRNLDKHLLPTRSFCLDAELLEHDALEPITYSGTRGHLNDAVDNFKIPLIDFMDLEGSHSILGRGGNAVVYSAKYQNQHVAVKRLHKKKINAKMVKNFLREALLSTKFDHANILKFYGVCVAPPNFLMIFEWCNRGDLGAFLKKERQTLTMGNRICLATQASASVMFFHSKGLVHRDIKPQNFLVHQQGHSITVKLADFGSCRSQHDAMPVFDGISPLFVAPEIRAKIPEDLRDIPKDADKQTMEYGPETDVFSQGWVLWAILTTGNWVNVLKGNAKGVRKGWLPKMKNIKKECRVIVNSCWTVDELGRPSMVDVHAGFASLWAQTENAANFFGNPVEDEVDMVQIGV